MADVIEIIEAPREVVEVVQGEGPVGPKGDTGNVGPQGPVGPKGDTGNVGPQGPVGPKGDTGDVGPQGPVGPKGDTGNVGPQGPVGPKGDTGNVGPQGPAGAAGASTWNDITGKPATFAPSAHAHAASDITSGTLDNARINFAAPPAIGAQNPNSGSFTNLWANSRLNLPSSGDTLNDIWVSGGQVRYQSGIQVTSARTLLTAEDNLSNLANAATARANLGLGTSNSVTFGSIQNTPIGSTTPSTGAFTTLSANNGTLTASAPVLDLAQTWNNAAVTFTGLRFNVTNTASALGSRLLEFQVNGSRQLSFDVETAANRVELNTSQQEFFIRCNGVQMLRVSQGGNWVSSLGAFLGISNDCFFARDGADQMSVRRGTNPQTFRLYNTYTDANNYERGFMRWSSNVLQIGTEKAGTGSARNLQFLTDNTARITIDTSGNVGVNVSAPERPFHISGGSMWARFDRTGTNGPAIMYVRQATLGTNTSVWLFGPHNAAGASNDDFAITDYGSTVSGTSGTTRLTIAKSDGQLTLNGNLNLSTKDLVTDTTTGTKIGTGTTQKLGFFNATPIVRPAAIADATDAATTQARLNDLLAAMRSLGLIAT